MTNKKYCLGIFEEDMSPEEERFNMEYCTNTKKRFQKLMTSSNNQRSWETVIKEWEICKIRKETQYRLFIILNDDDVKKKQVSEVKNKPVFDKK